MDKNTALTRLNEVVQPATPQRAREHEREKKKSSFSVVCMKIERGETLKRTEGRNLFPFSNETVSTRL